MKTELTKEQINEVKELTSDVRKELGVYSDVPVADDLRSFLEKKESLSANRSSLKISMLLLPSLKPVMIK